MTNHPTPTGETLEEALERAVFTDPATHPLRAEWEDARQREQAEYERVRAAEYDLRLEAHRLLRTPDPEAAARAETSLCAILFREDRDARLTTIWTDILRRVGAVLAARAATATPPAAGQAPVGGNGV